MNHNADKINLNGQEYVKKKPWILKYSIVFIVLAATVLGIYFGISRLDLTPKMDAVEEFVDDEIIGTEGEVTTISEAQIEEVFEINELQTADYIYNAVTRVYDTDGKTLKYYVAYEGKVTAGIDFSNVQVQVDEDSKTINISLPKVTVQDAIVEAGTLEYIFEDEEYNTDDVFKEAYTICQKDLDKRAVSEGKLLNIAKENAKQVVEAMIAPWVEQIDSTYSLNIV